MDFLEEAERLLQSGNPDFTELGTAFAMLALCERLDKALPSIERLNQNSLNSRKPEAGDTRTFYCKVCEKETLFVFEDNEARIIGKNWHCSLCSKTLTCSKRS